MHKTPILVALSALLLVGCASAPEGPSFSAMPGKGKSLQAFDRDDYDCQHYAYDRTQGRVDRANDKTAANTILVRLRPLIFLLFQAKRKHVVDRDGIPAFNPGRNHFFPGVILVSLRLFLRVR